MCLINCTRHSPSPEPVILPRPLSIRQPSLHSHPTPIPIPLSSRPSPRTSAPQMARADSHTSPHAPSSPRHSATQMARATSYTAPSPRTSQTHYLVTQTPSMLPPPPQGQVLVLPRSSGVSLHQVGNGVGYVYGEGPVPVQPSSSLSRQHSQTRQTSHSRQASLSRQVSQTTGMAGGTHRRSGSLGVERRGSAVYGKDPRASGASWRSTDGRERVVVIDARGVRREYYR